MKSVMRELAQARRHYSKLPFFEFLRCDAIAPRERLEFYPCMAPFILALADLNRFVLRDEGSQDPHQRLVNEHTYESDRRWSWYLEDYTKLGFDRVSNVAALLRSSMKDDTRESRMLAPRLAQVLHGARPVEKLVVVEAIEETRNVMFGLTSGIAAQWRAEGGPELRYLGQSPRAGDTAPAMHGLDHEVLAQIELDPLARVRCLDFAFRVFDLFADWSNELLAFAKNSAAQNAPAQRTVPHLVHGRTA